MAIEQKDALFTLVKSLSKSEKATIQVVCRTIGGEF